MADKELVPCTTMFSNGTEYMWFIEQWCDRCTRFRKGYCRVFRMTEKARYDEKYFPYDQLMDYKKYAGKACKRFTEEKQTRTRHAQQIPGQMEMEMISDDA